MNLDFLPLADPRGAPGTRAPPRGSKFFHFHAVFGKKLKNNSTFGSWRPPGENPGSATAYRLKLNLLVRLVQPTSEIVVLKEQLDCSLSSNTLDVISHYPESAFSKIQVSQQKDENALMIHELGIWREWYQNQNTRLAAQAN